MNEKAQKIQEQAKMNGVQTKVDSVKKQSIKDGIISEDSEVSSIFSKKDGDVSIPKYLYKVNKEDENLDDN